MTPADLFIELYLVAEQWDATSRTLAIEPDSTDREKIRRFVRGGAGDLAYRSLKALLPATYESDENRGYVLAVLQAIDRVFGEVHPRAQTSLSTSREPVPAWLDTLNEARSATGEYAKFDTRSLIPCGTFSRGHRHVDASFADRLADRYSSLALVSTVVQQDGRNIPVKTVVFGASGLQGVSQGARPGYETLTAIPIAEVFGELVLTEHLRGERRLVEYELAEGVDAASRMFQALVQAGSHDIAIAPELVMAETEVGKLRDLLDQNRIDCRLIVAGSGLSVDQRSGLAWNQTEVLNARGYRLWRQRKIWPAGINGDRAAQYGLESSAEGLRYELTASGDEVVIADVDGLGRCLVLICQDLEARSMTDDLVRQYQPDWVFTPILDPGIEHGRWAHQRALQLGATARSRFVVCTSTALPNSVASPKQSDCLLVVGPRDVTEQDGGRRFHLFGNEDGRSPGWVRCCWDDTNWPKIQLQPASGSHSEQDPEPTEETGGTALSSD
ncbi:hypothetical protein JFU49_03320 [Pseudomonas sp. TH03]|uniref:hypothetical protein n=1 Tax=Pseudomonas sp. TH03 TaxID=2796369 RepID=UPI0019119413|nr:hypothetical protein [Pseudomonas sp. TH03]MBK5549317.1 hypothetical protein [Pseudomonas sp. TH03]